MSKSSERSKFESRFAKNVIEVAVVTGAIGICARGCVRLQKRCSLSIWNWTP